MIPIKASGGIADVEVKKMKVITGDSRAEATRPEQVAKLGQTVVAGETFVFVFELLDRRLQRYKVLKVIQHDDQDDEVKLKGPYGNTFTVAARELAGDINKGFLEITRGDIGGVPTGNRRF